MLKLIYNLSLVKVIVIAFFATITNLFKVLFNKILKLLDIKVLLFKKKNIYF